MSKEYKTQQPSVMLHIILERNTDHKEGPGKGGWMKKEGCRGKRMSGQNSGTRNMEWSD